MRWRGPFDDFVAGLLEGGDELVDCAADGRVWVYDAVCFHDPEAELRVGRGVGDDGADFVVLGVTPGDFVDEGIVEPGLGGEEGFHGEAEGACGCGERAYDGEDAVLAVH